MNRGGTGAIGFLESWNRLAPPCAVQKLPGGEARLRWSLLPPGRRAYVAPWASVARWSRSAVAWASEQ